MKTCIALAMAVGLTFTAAGSVLAEESESSNSHLNVALFLWMEGLDPAEGWNGWTTMRCGIGETLLTANENMEVVPCLADSWEQIDDVTYKFHIRQGVKFSNGNELTPETVKESIERTAQQNSRGGNLKLESIEIDGENVIFKTTEPYSAFPYYLTEPMCIIVDTTVDMSNYNAAPVCTGPYVCDEYVPEEKYELSANGHYWNGVSNVESITVKNIAADTKVSAMLAGDLDVAVGASATTLSQVEGNESIEMVKVTGTRERMAYGVEFVVMGIDNQMKIHYGMPLRALLYDGLGYLKEYQEIAKQRKNEGGKVTEDEFLSKIRKEDRLHPIITIVIYYNEKPWDGPLCLRDMMVEMPEEISRIFSDYKMNLVQVRDSDRYIFNNEDVKTVFEISREIFRGNLDQITQKYNRDIDAELAAVIGQITDSNEITRQASKKEVVNMCTALEKWEKRAEEHGAENKQREIILKLLKKGYNAEQIEDLLDVPSSRVLIVQKEAE